MTALKLQREGKLETPLAFVAEEEEVAQRVKIRLLALETEYSFDREFGLDWLSWTQQKPPPIEEMATDMLSEVLEVDGVVDASIDPPDNPNAEELTFDIEVKLEQFIEGGSTVGIQLETKPGEPTARTVLIE